MLQVNHIQNNTTNDQSQQSVAQANSTKEGAQPDETLQPKKVEINSTPKTLPTKLANQTSSETINSLSDLSKQGVSQDVITKLEGCGATGVAVHTPKTLTITYGMAVPSGYIAVKNNNDTTVTCEATTGTVEFKLGTGKTAPAGSVPVGGGIYSLSFANNAKAITVPTLNKVTVTAKLVVEGTGQVLDTNTATALPGQDISLPSFKIPSGYEVVGTAPTMPTVAPKDNQTITETVKPIKPVQKPTPAPETPKTIQVTIHMKSTTGEDLGTKTETVNVTPNMKLPTVTFPAGYTQVSETVNGEAVTGDTFTLPKDLSNGVNVVYTLKAPEKTPAKPAENTTPKEVKVNVSFQTADGKAVGTPITETVSTEGTIKLPEIHIPDGYEAVSKTVNGTVEPGSEIKLPGDISKGITIVYTVKKAPTAGTTTKPGDSASKPGDTTTKPEAGKDNGSTTKPSTDNGKDNSTTKPEAGKDSNTAKPGDTTTTKPGDSTTKPEAGKDNGTTTAKPGDTATKPSTSTTDKDGKVSLTIEVYNTTTKKMESVQTLTGKEGDSVTPSPVAIPSGLHLQNITINGKEVAMDTKLPNKFGNINETIIYNVSSESSTPEPTIVPAKNVGKLPEAVAKEIKAVNGVVTKAPTFGTKVVTWGSVVPKGYIPVSKDGNNVTCETTDGVVTVTVHQGQAVPKTWKKVGVNTYEVPVTNQATPIKVQQDSSITVAVYKNGVKIGSTTYYGQVGDKADIKVPDLHGYKVVNINVNGETVTALPTTFGPVPETVVYNVADKTSNISIKIYNAAGEVVKTQQVSGYVGSTFNQSKLDLPKDTVITDITENGKQVNDITFGTDNSSVNVYTLDKDKALTDTVTFVNEDGYKLRNDIVRHGLPDGKLILDDGMLPDGYVVTKILVNGEAVNSVPTTFGKTNENIEIIMKKLPSTAGKDTSKDKGATSSTDNKGTTSSTDNKGTTSSTTTSTTGDSSESGSHVINEPAKVINEPTKVIHNTIANPAQGSYNPGPNATTSPITVASPMQPTQSAQPVQTVPVQSAQPVQQGSSIQSAAPVSGLPDTGTNGSKNEAMPISLGIGISAGLFALIESIRRRK